jgi:ABC-type branched-subunit amino acid transport system permease subunit
LRGRVHRQDRHDDLRLGCGIAGLGGVALSQIGNVGPDLGQGYIVDSFMVVVLGGVGQLAGTVIAASGWAKSTSSWSRWPAPCWPRSPSWSSSSSSSRSVRKGSSHSREGASNEHHDHAPLAVQSPGLGRDRHLHRGAGAAALCNLLFPAGSSLHVSSYTIALVGKIMCYAMAALALDLVWGYTGILSLGHGVFFALGGYAHGMYLMRAIGRDGVYQSDLPDFMVFLTGRPALVLVADRHFWFSMLLVVLVPGCWPSCSATSPSARASRACISPSSRRP